MGKSVHRASAHLKDVCREALQQAATALPSGRQADIAVVIPAYNESANLRRVLPNRPLAIQNQLVDYIVVDDGSTDDTCTVSKSAGCMVVRKGVNVGLGHTVATGLLCAARRGYSFAITLDADGQHRFEDLPELLSPLLKGEADLVIGSRILGKATMADQVRISGVRLFSWLISLLSQRTITDCSSGFRGYNLQHVEQLIASDPRHYTPEGIFRAGRKGLRICEVPVTITDRLEGTTKQGANWRYGLRYGFAIGRAWWRVTCRGQQPLLLTCG